MDGSINPRGGVMDTENITKVSLPALVTKIEGKNNQPDSVEKQSRAEPVSEELKNDSIESDDIDQAADEPKDIENVVIEMNARLQNEKRSIQFIMDEDNGQVVISVVDQNTGDEIKQIPSKELQELAKRMALLDSDQDEMTGMFVSKVV